MFYKPSGQCFSVLVITAFLCSFNLTLGFIPDMGKTKKKSYFMKLSEIRNRFLECKSNITDLVILIWSDFFVIFAPRPPALGALSLPLVPLLKKWRKSPSLGPLLSPWRSGMHISYLRPQNVTFHSGRNEIVHFIPAGMGHCSPLLTWYPNRWY